MIAPTRLVLRVRAAFAERRAREWERSANNAVVLYGRDGGPGSVEALYRRAAELDRGKAYELRRRIEVGRRAR